MHKNAAQKISFCGLMVALAVLFQSAPVFLPVAGLAISPLSSLPIALAVIRSKPYGFASWLASALVLLAVYPQEAAIFTCATGLIGLLLGLLYAKKMYVSIIVSSFALFTGILVLSFLLCVPVLGDFTVKTPPAVLIPVLIAFSVVYATVWAYILRLAVRFLIKVKVFKRDQY